MQDGLGVTPLRFQPGFEMLEDGETETGQAIADTLHSINETTFKDYGHAVRSVHAKSHGLLRGRLTVREDLLPIFAQGVFAGPGSYDVVMRFSTNPGDILDDSISVPRGLALKIIGVAGDRLPGSEGEVTQDFVMADAPSFQAPTAAKFLGSLKPLAATTDAGQGFKKVLSAALRGAETLVEALGGESAKLKGLGGHAQTNILGATFYSQVPVLYGSFIAKVSVAPASPSLTALEDQAVETSGRPNALRDTVQSFFAAQGAEWDIRVQLCTDLERMPIEDASVRWSEELSPYVTVGRIVMPSQSSWDDAKQREIDDGMAFSPWHGIAEHRPLGSIMRTRKASYEMSAKFRASHNGCPMQEPR